MNMIKRTCVLKFLVGICLLGLCMTVAFAYFVGNDTHKAFISANNSPIHSNCAAATSPGTQCYREDIEPMVGWSAGYYLAAKARTDELTQMTEWFLVFGDTNPERKARFITCKPKAPTWDDMCEALNCAIENISNAHDIYRQLSTNATSDKYDPKFVGYLKIFPYDEFFEKIIENPTELDYMTCAEIKRLLQPEESRTMSADLASVSDVNGIYKTLQNRTCDLLSRMRCLLEIMPCDRESFDALILDTNRRNKIVGALWKINHCFAWAHMFGQYVSEVFIYIDNNRRCFSRDSFDLSCLNNIEKTECKIPDDCRWEPRHW